MNIACMNPRGMVVLALATVFGAAVSPVRAGDEAVRTSPNPSATLVVNPANDPVKTTVLGTATVTGSVTVEGTPSVNATITNTPAVTLAGTPTVVVAPEVTVAAVPEQMVVIPAGDLRFWFRDVSQYEEVRIAVRTPSLQNHMTLFVHTGSLNIDSVPLNGIENVTRNYRVPGTLLGVTLSNENGTEEEHATIAVYGRP